MGQHVIFIIIVTCGGHRIYYGMDPHVKIGYG